MSDELVEASIALVGGVAAAHGRNGYWGILLHLVTPGGQLDRGRAPSPIGSDNRRCFGSWHCSYLGRLLQPPQAADPRLTAWCGEPRSGVAACFSEKHAVGGMHCCAWSKVDLMSLLKVFLQAIRERKLPMFAWLRGRTIQSRCPRCRAPITLSRQVTEGQAFMCQACGESGVWKADDSQRT
jgi:hypothetical protein